MNKQEIIEKLNYDLMNEYKHMLFYLSNSVQIRGLHVPEIREYFEEQAKEEMEHVKQFSDLIRGLDGIPFSGPHASIQCSSDLYHALNNAISMEQEALDRYVVRMSEVVGSSLSATDKAWIEIFLEKQIEDTRQDVDKMKQYL
jgi:bacterioferritin